VTLATLISFMAGVVLAAFLLWAIKLLFRL